MSQFEIIARSDVPTTMGKGRESGLTAAIRQLTPGQALRIAIGDRHAGGVQTWVFQRARKLGVPIRTTRDAEYVYVWLKEASE